MYNFYGLPLVLDPQPEGGYTITCPLLPELITEADGISQVYSHVADALAAVIELNEDMKARFLLPHQDSPLTRQRKQ